MPAAVAPSRKVNLNLPPWGATAGHDERDRFFVCWARHSVSIPSLTPPSMERLPAALSLSTLLFSGRL